MCFCREERSVELCKLSYCDVVRPPRSAYLHIPFCHRRCFYCDFAIIPIGDQALKNNANNRSFIESYLRLLHQEISFCQTTSPLSTVYIGGGTPSLLEGEQVESLLQHLQDKFGIQDGAEITLEIDPSTFDQDKLDSYLYAGINRISLGGQSFDSKILNQIGRRHTREELIEACHWLNIAYKSGLLRSWSLDLIQNLPDQSLTSWEDQLLQAVESGANHFSIYDLSIEPGTLFYSKKNNGELNLPDEDIAADSMRLTNNFLSKKGFSRYEISNYSLPCHASRHNRVYWSGSGWWAFGQGATSSPWGERFTRPRTFFGYKKWVEKESNKSIHLSFNEISSKGLDFEDQLIVGLRKREGIDFKSFERIMGWTSIQCNYYIESFTFSLKDQISDRLLIKNGCRFYLANPLGMELSNQVLVQAILWWESISKDSSFQRSKSQEP